MTEVVRDSHPDPEVLAAFVDGNLKGAELINLADHLRQCAECRMIAGEASRFEREQQSQRHSSRALWPWTAVAAAAAAIIVFVIAPRFRDPMNELQPQSQRPYLGRFTSFQYAPYGATRSTEQHPDYRRFAAAAQLRDRLDAARTPASLHRFALAEAALGRSEQASALLREAAAANPDNVAILADLAGAEVSTGNGGAAVRAATRALNLDHSSTAAAFNLALGQELMNDPGAAVDAWTRYLQLDRSSPWAEEARSRLARLQSRNFVQ